MTIKSTVFCLLMTALSTQTSLAQYYYANNERVMLTVDEHALLVKCDSTLTDNPGALRELFSDMIDTVATDSQLLHGFVTCMLTDGSNAETARVVLKNHTLHNRSVFDRQIQGPSDRGDH